MNIARRIFCALAIGIWLLVMGGILGCAVRMPGHSFKGDPPPLMASETILCKRLHDHVHILAMEIGQRNRPNYKGLDRARAYIEEQFKQIGLEAKSIPYKFQGDTFYNVEAILKGSEPFLPGIVIGAHYDSFQGSPGANDNATGVAALLELARLLSQEKLTKTIRFVAFANEELPYFNTREGMGSIEYVKYIRSFQDPKAAIDCMMSLETIGYYRDDKGSQTYPWPIGWFYPSKGNFIAFVGNFESRRLVRSVVRSFRRNAMIPSEGGALSVRAAGLSDHRSFWEAGIPALMVTDTAEYRDPEYHLPTDKATDKANAERLRYDQMARVVSGLYRAVLDLSQEKT